MFALMLVDTPDDRYRDHQSGTPWRRVGRLIAAAVACFLVGAFVLPGVGFLLDIGAVVLVLLALCALDD
jgi:Flp pilus assembly protein TadB